MSNLNNKGLRDPIWQFIWGAVAAVLAIIAIIVGILALPQAAPARNIISHTFAGTTPTEVIPTATPSPIPTPQVIQINQTMTCVCATDAGNFNFSLIVRNATIDRAKVQVTLLIGLQNNSSNATSTQLQFIRFQDQQTGETTEGVGEGFSSTQFAPNQLILFRPTFQFVPVAGHKYSLSAELAGTFDFSPITITF